VEGIRVINPWMLRSSDIQKVSGFAEHLEEVARKRGGV
jgi:hypothetical protein